jgi:hypothetical protein
VPSPPPPPHPAPTPPTPEPQPPVPTARGCGVPTDIPPWLKVAHTGFVAVLVPTYWRQYGPGNFLWFSDVALLTSIAALWRESSLLASTEAVGVLVPETLWLVDFGSGLLTGQTPIGLAGYMFDRRLGRFVRALSLFHLWLTPVLLLVVWRRGYDRRALRYQIIATSLILLASWRFTSPQENVNWVYALPGRIRTRRARAAFVALLIVAMPLAFHIPAHLLLKRLFPRGRARHG